MELLKIHITMNSVELDQVGVLRFVIWFIMSDASESRKTSTGMENLSLRNRFPRDLLQRFMGTTSRQSELKQEEYSEDIELNLGLSLGGRFGVDKSSHKLVRSSSIAGPIPIARDDEALIPPSVAAYSGLVRTSSLPVETEEEWRKRKEQQTLRRMEAKRRRSEKQRILKGDKDGGGSGCLVDERRDIEVNLRGGVQREQYVTAMNKVGSSVTPPFGLPSWASAARQTILGGGIEALLSRGKGNYVDGDGGGGGGGGSSLQGSVDSHGGCFSNMSELESKPLQGSSSNCGNTSTGSIQSIQDQSDHETAGSSGKKTGEKGTSSRGGSGAELDNPSRRSDKTGNRTKETGMNSLEDMPCVFTKGDGPNGRRIEGILYKYGKGEEVRIMCVCHGTFHSPAGFVKHAGGSDVTHPLKHIVVNPNSSFS